MRWPTLGMHFPPRGLHSRHDTRHDAFDYRGVWVVATATPGPDFLLVTRMSLLNGRREALRSVAEISVGILAWGIAGFFGIHALFLAMPLLYFALKIGGGAYLIHLGVRLLRESFRAVPGGALGSDLAEPKSPDGFKLGLMTNLSNPKVAIFTTSLFAATLPPNPSLALGMMAIAMMVSIGAVWFVFVAHALTAGPVAALFRRARRGIDRVAGVVFIAFGARLAWAARQA